ncbi:glycosyltransferase family 2 protein [Neokomagataea anthophila]|uniref:Glycosyltransferase family 2 protein n=1 Tax=Neokomagataea anthophila TaxID=2826925 RepID=A0ABS5E8A1_9PROT|nr:glycosyltransferase family 2 protein [Neokomagataea anthophila]MBR0560133.1 glycosyltransferase family 2 protein [Neokomagataea anthophila]
MTKATCALLCHNAASTLTEWVAWHIMQGFERILIIDAGSTDHTVPLAQSLNTKIEYEIIERPDTTSLPPEERRIVLIDTAHNHTPSDHWLLILDQDEFLDLNEPLDAFLADCTDEHGIGLYWKTFGPSISQTPAQLSISAFSHRAPDDFIDHHAGRIFARPSHHPLTSSPFWDGTEHIAVLAPRKGPAAPRILHYPWLADPDMPQHLAQHYSHQDIEDLTPLRHAQTLNATINALTEPQKAFEDDVVTFDTFSIRRIRPTEEEKNLLK